MSVFRAFKKNRGGIDVNIEITQYFNVLSLGTINTKCKVMTAMVVKKCRDMKRSVNNLEDV
jgi:hypothetical protein